MEWLHWIDRLDKIILVLINNDSDHRILDNVMMLLRNPFTWIPLYIFMSWFAIKKGKTKAWRFIILSILTFSITDSITSRILKPLFARPRPCYDSQLHGLIRPLVECGGLDSFPSSHAANHFGLAAFWYWSIWMMTGKKWGWLWIWALLICYAQVYVGKHYPSDILAGAIFGTLVGLTSARIFYRWAHISRNVGGQLIPDPNQNPSSIFHNQV